MLFILLFLGLLLLFLFLDKKKLSLSLNQVLLIATGARLLIFFFFPNSKSEDLLSFLTAGKIILERQPIYLSLYFPFFSYLGALAILLKDLFHPLILLKFSFSLFDIGIVYLVYLITRNNVLALMYAVNPITLINTNIHGQFDTIPLFPSFGSLSDKET